jgi:hypothetical protein
MNILPRNSASFRFTTPATRFTAALCVIALFGIVTTVANAQTLHQQIDKLIAAQAGGPVSPVAPDAEFLRRIYLDLTGTIPTADEARAFLKDADPKKREKLIDRLLASPQYARRMQEAFTVMLLERREGAVVSNPQWNDYLRASFADNKPFDQLAREILGSDGLDEKSQPGMRFFVDGGRLDANQMTRDVGRLFLGMDMQCNQCHDNPNVDQYKQADYYGLLAFLSPSKLQSNKYFIDTPLTAKLDFQSVFYPDEKKSIGPRLPGGKEVEIPQFEKGQELAQPAKDGLPAIPKFRPRVLLAEQLASASNEPFKQNSVNRFWYLMMGRGLVMPLDLMHKDNPPSHPEVMKLLADQFAAHRFDVKWLLKELALSETYQRGSLLPDGVEAKDAPPERYRAANAKPLSAEQLAWSIMQATGNLDQVLAAPIAAGSKFTYNDYVNGRIKDPPGNLLDTMTLFVGVFGNPPGEAEVEYNPAMGHALYFMNERLVLGWLKPRAGNLVERLSKVTEPDKIADEIYLSVLSRFPDDEEKAEVAEYLTKFPARRSDALGEIAWALLASAEFRLNH